MSATLSPTAVYDDTALVAFLPDGTRATFLYARMIESLAQSVGEIIRGCAPHLEFKDSVLRLPHRLRDSSRVPAELYCVYFDLLQAVRRDDLDASKRLLIEMDTFVSAELPPFYRQWGTLPESTAGRYLTYVNADPTTKVDFKALSSSQFNQACRLADQAFGVLGRAAPELAAEIRSLLTEIVFVSSGPGVDFDGATSFFCWGALFLNAERHNNLIMMIDGLSHESAHAHLFSSLVASPSSTTLTTSCMLHPLRRDPRPLDGTFHATYVSARMHYAHSRALEAGVLSKPEQKDARKALAWRRTAFQDGLKTLNEYASLTPLGDRVMDGARGYMSGGS